MSVVGVFQCQIEVSHFAPMKRFGEKLHQLRQQRGLTLQELSDQLEVSTTHIWNLENGRKIPNVALVIKLSDIFGVTADQLIRDELELD